MSLVKTGSFIFKIPGIRVPFYPVNDGQSFMEDRPRAWEPYAMLPIALPLVIAYWVLQKTRLRKEPVFFEKDLDKALESGSLASRVRSLFEAVKKMSKEIQEAPIREVMES